jgi:hypothetical protein
MRKRLLQLGRIAFIGLVVAGLTFGASQAFASMGSSECSLCDYPDQEECNTCCVDVLHMSGGVCFESGSCVCF